MGGGGAVRRRSTKYAEGWQSFSRWARFERARGRCECRGECGLHQQVMAGGRRVPRRCIEQNGEPARYMRQGTIVMLTVAHLNAEGGPCQCDPRCIIPEHVLALCQRCHLRYDGPRHQANARDSRLRREGEQAALL